MPQETKKGLRFTLILLRIFCYGALVPFALSLVAMDVLAWMGACPRMDTGAIICTTETTKWIAETSKTILMSGIFLGIPLLLGGLAFLAYDTFRLIQRLAQTQGG